MGLLFVACLVDEAEEAVHQKIVGPGRLKRPESPPDMSRRWLPCIAGGFCSRVGAASGRRLQHFRTSPPGIAGAAGRPSATVCPEEYSWMCCASLTVQ